MEDARRYLGEDKRKQLNSEASQLSSKFIMDMIDLCDKYGVDRDWYIRESFAMLLQSVKQQKFSGMEQRIMEEMNTKED